MIHIVLVPLVRACKYKNDHLRVRLPIRKRLMNLILDKIEDYFMDKNQPYLCSLYRAMISTGYYGLLRVGELASGTNPILACNLHYARNKHKIQIVLKSSKTHTIANQPQKVTIVKNESFNSVISSRSSKYCPSEILMTYLSQRDLRDNDKEPFFVFRDATPVQPYHVRCVLKYALKNIGLDDNNYGTHSLRSGRAVDL